MPVLREELSFFRELSDKDLSSIKKRLAEKTFAKDELLSTEGNACAAAFFVKSGWIKMYRTSPSGAVQSLEVLGPGETCTCNPGALHWICTLTGQALTALHGLVSCQGRLRKVDPIQPQAVTSSQSPFCREASAIQFTHF